VRGLGAAREAKERLAGQAAGKKKGTKAGWNQECRIMKSRAYNLVTASVFTVVAVAHLARVCFGVAVIVGGWTVPLWLSWVGLVAAGILCIWGFSSRSFRAATQRCLCAMPGLQCRHANDFFAFVS